MGALIPDLDSLSRADCVTFLTSLASSTFSISISTHKIRLEQPLNTPVLLLEHFKMSRRLNTGARGRQSQAVSFHKPQLKLSFGGKTGKKNGSREVITIPKNARKRRAPSVSEAESTTSGESSAEEDFDDDSEEADDESEDPEVDALLHGPPFRGGAGPDMSDEESDHASDLGEWAGFPELPGQEPLEWDQEMNRKLFDSDDDLEYEKVNEVSDMEDDEEAEFQSETQLFANELNEEMTSHFANQIDGMSAYGFGDNSDDEESVVFPWSSSDEANDARTRHVRFEEPMDLSEQQKVGIPNAFAVFGHSPAMARALLPSALPEKSSESDIEQNAEGSDDGYDSDATEELEAPAQAWQLSSVQRMARPETISLLPVAKRTPGQKGPTRGTFEDDGEKPSAILDSTGKKLLLQDSHLLGGVFARKYGPSVPTSPSNSFASAVLNESDSSGSVAESPNLQNVQPHPTIDLMLAALNSGDQISADGQVSGLPEAFMPANQALLQQFIDEDAMGDDDDDDGPDGKLRLEDMLVFEMENDDDSGLESPFSSFLPDSFSAPATPLPHLNGMNVTAFRRMADATNYFTGSRHSPIKNKFATPLKRKRRSDRYDSPYNDAHYQGVTPVQRITFHEASSSPAPPSSRMHKRRKTIV